MSIRSLIAALLVSAYPSVQADEVVRPLIERGAWTDAQIRVYDRLWEKHPTPEVAISMACSGFLDLALLRARNMPAVFRSYVLTRIGKDCLRLTISQRTNILDEALRTTTTPDQRTWIALAWLQLGKPDQAITIARGALHEAHGSSQYTRQIIDALALSQVPSFATALAQDLVLFAHATPSDNDPYIYIDLARLLGLASDEKGQKKALDDAFQRVVFIPVGQRPFALRGIVEVALRSDQIALAASITPQQNVFMQWADYYARHSDYKMAVSLTEGMSDTLYVSHRQDSLANTIRKAVYNGDMKAASDLVERLVKNDSKYASLQLIIGNAYCKANQQAEASTAYARGIARYIQLNEAHYSEYDVRVLAQLSLAARHNGQPVIADHVMGLLPTLISKIYPKNLEGQVLSRVYFATLLNERGERKAASTRLMEANELLTASSETENKLSYTRLELALAEGLDGEFSLEVLGR
jgi:hypothetical protein